MNGGVEDVSPRALVTLGETLVLFLPDRSGRVTDAATAEIHTGGAESNVAIAVTRLGLDAEWIGRVGRDSAGDRVLRDLRAEGVRVHAVRSDAPTAIMIKERPVRGLSRVTYHRGSSAGSELEPDDIDEHVIANAGVLHVTGITPSLSPSAARAADRAVTLAQSANVPVSFDVNFRPSLWRGRDPLPALRPFAARADVLFASRSEALLLLGSDAQGAPDEEVARELARTFDAEAVVTLGPEGAVVAREGRVYREAAVAIDAVDTVGAGDGFVGGYLAELLYGRSIADRLCTAVTVGAFACTASGDWSGYPTRQERELLIRADPVSR